MTEFADMQAILGNAMPCDDAGTTILTAWPLASTPIIKRGCREPGVNFSHVGAGVIDKG